MQRSTSVLNALLLNQSSCLAMQRKCREGARNRQSASNKKRRPQNKTAGLAPGGLPRKSSTSLARRAAGTGIPLRIGIERRLHQEAADDRNDAVADHHEHFARLQFAVLVVANEAGADDRRQREAADRGQAEHLERMRAGEALEPAVVIGGQQVRRRHAAAGNDLGHGHIRAAIVEQEGFRRTGLEDKAKARHEHCKSDKVFFHELPPVRWSFRASEGRAVPVEFGSLVVSTHASDAAQQMMWTLAAYG